MSNNNINDLSILKNHNSSSASSCEEILQTSINQSYINNMNYYAKKRINLYKTEMCRSFEEVGFCKYGERCQFAHQESEIRRIDRHPRYKTETCRTFWEEGTCPYGKRCCFIHLERNNNTIDTDDDVIMSNIDTSRDEDVMKSKSDSIQFLDEIEMKKTNKSSDLTIKEEIIKVKKCNKISEDFTYEEYPPLWDLKPFWEGNESLVWCKAEMVFCYIKYRKYRHRTHESTPLAPGGPLAYKPDSDKYKNELDKLGL